MPFRYLSVTLIEMSDRAVTLTRVSGFLIPGVILGAFAGWAWHRAHRTWTDWRRTKASVGALRRLFWRHGFQGLLWAAGLLFLVWVWS